VTILVLIHSPFRNWTIPPSYVDALRRAFPGDTVLHAVDDEEGLRLIAGADIAFASHITPAQLAAASRLQWIHSPAAGVGHLLHPEMIRRPITITNGRGTSADTMAEHVIAVVLALFRRLPTALARQAAHVWAQDEIASPPGNRTIAGSHALIVGLGAIGAATAVRLNALGAAVTGIRRRPGGAAVPGVAAIHSRAALHELLPAADIVVLSVPQTAETRALIGEPELGCMKTDAILVNVSRGALIDEGAMARALRSGTLGGAALDVFRDEPLPPDSPMWDVPNLLITPHVSGFRRDHWDAAIALFADNRRRFAAGQPLLNLVDKSAGY
jgi:phosphoglycerate dehydrogenase-like enzyme